GVAQLQSAVLFGARAGAVGGPARGGLTDRRRRRRAQRADFRGPLPRRRSADPRSHRRTDDARYPARRALSGALRLPDRADAADVTVSVRVAKAERGTISSEVTALGTVFPREQATVSPKINAQIKSMALVRNKRVKAGEVIATLESRDLQAQRAEAASALQEAQATRHCWAAAPSPGPTPRTT